MGIGGDPIIGTRFLDALALFEADNATEAVVLIGEIGGTDEEEAAAYIQEHLSKPVVAFVAGQTAPPGKRMGHAGAIVSGGSGTAQEKMARFEAVGIPVARTPSEIPILVRDALKGKRTRPLRVVTGAGKAARPRKAAAKPARARAKAAAKAPRTAPRASARKARTRPRGPAGRTPAKRRRTR
jgi:hypothetical protein